MIDGGKPFDWGRTSEDYAKYRDIYPREFYEKIFSRRLCVDGQRVLDLGTGTGVIPRNMYEYGAKWTGIDISEKQIAQAKRLSEGMDIDYYTVSAEETDFPDCTFDVITACQCFWYFDTPESLPNAETARQAAGAVYGMAAERGQVSGGERARSAEIQSQMERRGRDRPPIHIPDCYFDKFKPVYNEEYPLLVPFTRESWNGRMKACRGVGASLSESEIVQWEREHTKMLKRLAPEKFEVKHYAAIAELEKT